MNTASIAPSGLDQCDAASTGGSNMEFGPYTAHPVAALFPLLDPSSDAFNYLKGSILRNGLLHPIVLDSDGRILDGRNRYQACIAAYREPRFVQFADLGLPPNEDGEPVAEAEYAFDQNFARRDLPADQRVAIAVLYGKVLDDLERVRRGAPKGNTNKAGKTKTEKSNMSDPTDLMSTAKAKPAPTTRKKAAAKAHVSEHKMQQAMNLAKTDPEALAEVAAGKLKLKDAMPKPVLTDAGTRVGLEVKVKRSTAAADDHLRAMEGRPRKARVDVIDVQAREVTATPSALNADNTIETLKAFAAFCKKAEPEHAAHAVCATDVRSLDACLTKIFSWLYMFSASLHPNDEGLPAARNTGSPDPALRALSDYDLVAMVMEHLDDSTSLEFELADRLEGANFQLAMEHDDEDEAP